MKLEDWHTHSALCHHAVGSIEDYIRKAIELELTTIGLCDHFPFEYLKNIERIPENCIHGNGAKYCLDNPEQCAEHYWILHMWDGRLTCSNCADFKKIGASHDPNGVDSPEIIQNTTNQKCYNCKSTENIKKEEKNG